MFKYLCPNSVSTFQLYHAAPSEIVYHAQPVPVAFSSALELYGAKEKEGARRWIQWSNTAKAAKAPSIAYISQLFCVTGTNDMSTCHVWKLKINCPTFCFCHDVLHANRSSAWYKANHGHTMGLCGYTDRTLQLFPEPWRKKAKAWADVSCRMHKFQIVPMFPPGARWDFFNLWKRPRLFESICCLAITLRSLPLELMLECSCITPKDLRNWTLQCPKTSKNIKTIQDNPRQHRRTCRTYSWHFMTKSCFYSQQRNAPNCSTISTHFSRCHRCLVRFVALWVPGGPYSEVVFELRATLTTSGNQCMRDESIVRNTQLDISDMTVELNTVQLDTIDNWYHFPHRSHDRNQINQGLWELGLWAASAASPLLPAVVLTGLTWENSIAHQGDNFTPFLWENFQ